MYDNIIPLILQNTYHLGETMTGAVMALDNVLAIFLAYPAAAGIFAGVVVPLGVTPLSGSLVAGISVVLYAASWVLARRKIAFRDVA